MARSMPGGRELITRIADLCKVIQEELSFDRRTLVTDPDAVEDARDVALDCVEDILRAIQDDLPPLLERNERKREIASIPERMDRLEAELAEIRQRLDGPALRLVPEARKGGEAR